MSQINIKTMMQSSGVAFGTSGARGLVSSMTEEVCAAYVSAFLNVISPLFTFERVALGMDLRPSSPDIASACTKAITQAGLQVDYCGSLPTPALALYAQQQHIPAVMVTGSHIPFDRNGIKFYRPDGEISKADEQAMTESVVEPVNAAVSGQLPAVNRAATTAYAQRYTDFFPQDSLKGFRLGLYEHSSVARDVFKHILQTLGAEVVSLERTEYFVPIDTEAVSVEDRQRGVEWSRQYGFDAIISTDGDGDRPLLSDEQGGWLRGDIVGLLCARYLGVQAVALPVSCNTAIELSGYFSSIIRTRIGSPYVIAGMQQLSEHTTAIAGFEANGGFLVGPGIALNGKSLDALATRDAVLPVLAVLAYAKQQGVQISQLLTSLPQRFTASDRLQNIPTATTQQCLAEWQQDINQLCEVLGPEFGKINTVNTDDGLRITFANADILHLRGSGNAPELRCYYEADSLERAEQRNAMALLKIADFIA